MAALLGRTVGEMYESLTQREYMKWQQYWVEEPWGPWRDNMHAAILAREVRRQYVPSGSLIKLDSFMVRRPIERLREAEGGLWSMLSVIAVKKPQGDLGGSR